VLEAREEATLLAEPTALFSARVDPRTRAEVGQTLELAVDPSRFHFFDPASGTSLLDGRQAPAAAVPMDLTTSAAGQR
jgi:hypothetical protein